MLKKKLSLILTFATTTQAMAVEAFCHGEGLPGRLIPVPREITAGCGLSWKALPEDKDLLLESLSQGGLVWQECHLIEV